MRKYPTPLYLRVVAEELRLHGEHETLDRVIDHYGQAADLEEVFQKVLERMEKDYGSEAIGSLLSLIWGSRFGLSEIDLLLLTGLSRVDFSRLLFALDYHLIRRDGRLGFFHDYLRRAVEQRYLTEESVRQQRRRELRDYFAEAEITLSSTLELLYALEKLGEEKELKRLLVDIPRYLLLWQGLERFEVMAHWAGSEPQEIVEAYRNSLQLWKDGTMPDKGEEAEVLSHVGRLFTLIPEWSEAERLYESRLELLRELGDREGISQTLSKLSHVSVQIGNLDKAAERVAEAETIARESGNLIQLGRALSEQGRIALSRGEFAKAETDFTESLEVYQQAKDSYGIYIANTGLGATHFAVGNYREAHTYSVMSDRVARELSNRFEIAAAIANVGMTNLYLGNNAEAMLCFREQETIARELGARDLIAASLWNQGHLYTMQNEYAQALACVTEQETIVRELGTRHALISGLNLRGEILKDLGRLEEALHCFDEQEELSREIQDQYGLAVALGARAGIFLTQENYEKALDYYQQQRDIHQTTGAKKGLYMATGNLGTVYLAQQKYEEAISLFEEAARGHEELNYLYGVSFNKVSIAKALAEITIDLTEMPSFLLNYIPDISPENWQADTLRKGRQLAEEGVTIGTDIRTSDSIFVGKNVLARINAAMGNYEEAVAIMRALLLDPAHEQEKSASSYWLWKILRSENRQPEEIEKGRQEALRSAEEDYNKSPTKSLKERIEELVGEENATKV
ncbi:MAG: tetratricopeptide repeat protein [Ignavibacteriae bacterium]|nr:tetratricopeptide repeat protein [Ignavibacteriota bacterium]